MTEVPLTMEGLYEYFHEHAYKGKKPTEYQEKLMKLTFYTSAGLVLGGIRQMSKADFNKEQMAKVFDGMQKEFVDVLGFNPSQPIKEEADESEPTSGESTED